MLAPATEHMKQLLGEKKRRKVEGILGEPVVKAVVRGGWPVNWCRAWTGDGNCWWVNFKTNKVGHQYMKDGERMSDYVDDAEQAEIEAAMARHADRVARLRMTFDTG